MDNALHAPSTVDFPAPGAVERISRLLGESASLLDERRDAYARLCTTPRPDRVRHVWRFSDPERLLPADETPTRPGPVTYALPPAAAARVVLRPGAAPDVVLSGAADRAGLTVAPLDSFLDTLHPSEETADDPSPFFHALNDALWNCGVRVALPAGARLDGPVIVQVPALSAAVLPRLVIDAAEGSELVVVEEHHGGRDGVRVVGRTELQAGPDARLTHVLVQRWEAGVHGHLSAHGWADRDAELRTVFVSLGGDRAKVELVTDLRGPGARSEMRGVALGADSQRFDHHTRHRHVSGRTSSDIDFKAVADGAARSSYTGLIRIEEEARESAAFQENRNLLLSEQGRADSIPELEILNEEVSCSHGATVAPIDPEQLFYLQSRGLAPAAALRLVVRGFLGGTLDRLPAGVRDRVEDLVAARLENLGGRAA